jgi:hypothetical protein
MPASKDSIRAMYAPMRTSSVAGEGVLLWICFAMASAGLIWPESRSRLTSSGVAGPESEASGDLGCLGPARETFEDGGDGAAGAG